MLDNPGKGALEVSAFWLLPCDPGRRRGYNSRKYWPILIYFHEPLPADAIVAVWTWRGGKEAELVQVSPPGADRTYVVATMADDVLGSFTLRLDVRVGARQLICVARKPDAKPNEIPFIRPQPASQVDAASFFRPRNACAFVLRNDRLRLVEAGNVRRSEPALHLVSIAGDAGFQPAVAVPHDLTPPTIDVWVADLGDLHPGQSRANYRLVVSVEAADADARPKVCLEVGFIRRNALGPSRSVFPGVSPRAPDLPICEDIPVRRENERFVFDLTGAGPGDTVVVRPFHPATHVRLHRHVRSRQRTRYELAPRVFHLFELDLSHEMVPIDEEGGSLPIDSIGNTADTRPEAVSEIAADRMPPLRGESRRLFRDALVPPPVDLEKEVTKIFGEFDIAGAHDDFYTMTASIQEFLLYSLVFEELCAVKSEETIRYLADWVTGRDPAEKESVERAGNEPNILHRLNDPVLRLSGPNLTLKGQILARNWSGSQAFQPNHPLDAAIGLWASVVDIEWPLTKAWLAAASSEAKFALFGFYYRQSDIMRLIRARLQPAPSHRDPGALIELADDVIELSLTVAPAADGKETGESIVHEAILRWDLISAPAGADLYQRVFVEAVFFKFGSTAQLSTEVASQMLAASPAKGRSQSVQVLMSKYRDVVEKAARLLMNDVASNAAKAIATVRKLDAGADVPPQARCILAYITKLREEAEEAWLRPARQELGRQLSGSQGPAMDARTEELGPSTVHPDAEFWQNSVDVGRLVNAFAIGSGREWVKSGHPAEKVCNRAADILDTWENSDGLKKTIYEAYVHHREEIAKLAAQETGEAIDSPGVVKLARGQAAFLANVQALKERQTGVKQTIAEINDVERRIHEIAKEANDENLISTLSRLNDNNITIGYEFQNKVQRPIILMDRLPPDEFFEKIDDLSKIEEKMSEIGGDKLEKIVNLLDNIENVRQSI